MNANPRTKKRDDLIRRKAETELLKRNSITLQVEKKKPKPNPNTVASLRPVKAITVLESAKISQAAQLMAAKKADAVLAVDSHGHLSGILTDKDITYRVVAQGLNLRSTTVASAMTPNPISVVESGSRNEALSIMVEKRFRHLPVISDECVDDESEFGVPPSAVHSAISVAAGATNVVGLLDITKCVFDKLDDLERKANEDANIVAAMEALERRGHVGLDHVGQVRSSHACPDLHSVLIRNADEVTVPEVSSRATVADAAKVMREFHQTAVLVVGFSNGISKLEGIFTTKDMVLRTIAAGLDPNMTSVIRCMTIEPDTVDTSTTILEAMKKLHVGHYLHLPVVENHIPVGLVDVMTLTMAMLEYLMTKEQREEMDSQASDINNGPLWNKFWNSTFAGSINETETVESVISHEDEKRSIPHGHSEEKLYTPHADEKYSGPLTPQPLRNSAMRPVTSNIPLPSPNRHASHKEMSVSGSIEENINKDIFQFKLREADGIYRITSSSKDIRALENGVKSKLGCHKINGIKYQDEDGDWIAMNTDEDLVEAVGLARRLGWDRILLTVGKDKELYEFYKDSAVIVGVAAGLLLLAFFVVKNK